MVVRNLYVTAVTRILTKRKQKRKYDFSESEDNGKTGEYQCCGVLAIIVGAGNYLKCSPLLLCI